MILVKRCLNNSTVKSDQYLYKKTLLNKFVSKLTVVESHLRRCQSGSETIDVGQNYIKTGLWDKSNTIWDPRAKVTLSCTRRKVPWHKLCFASGNRSCAVRTSKIPQTNLWKFAFRGSERSTGWIVPGCAGEKGEGAPSDSKHNWAQVVHREVQTMLASSGMSEIIIRVLCQGW